MIRQIFRNRRKILRLTQTTGLQASQAGCQPSSALLSSIGFWSSRLPLPLCVGQVQVLCAHATAHFFVTFSTSSKRGHASDFCLQDLP